MKRTIYRLLFFCLLLVSFSTAKAVDERYAAPALHGNQLAPDSTSMVMDTVYFNPGLKPLQTTYFVKNLITFQINESYRNVLPDEFTVQIKFVVHYVRDNNGTQVPEISAEKTLTVQYSKFVAYGNKMVYMDKGWYKAEVEITGITAVNGNLNDFREALMLTNEILVSREYNFNCTNNSIKYVYPDTTTINQNGELNVHWQTERAADEYDLEWAYIDSLALSNYKTDGVYNIKKIFNNNATRVSIHSENYNIPLLYEASGILFCRVRAVQVKQNGQRIESVWSTDYTAGLGTYGFRGLDPYLNWQATTSFAEEGKRKSVVQYFDGSLKSRQTVTKDNTTDTTVIAETFYDHQGRPAIQVMPTPSLSSIIKYTPGFNTLNGAEYRKDEYDGILQDTCYCQVGAPAMDKSSGASNYYSPLNPLSANGYHKYIPDAEGFVFAETQYTPDNTGRISAQGGVGKTFRIGNKHTTNYTYGAADQEELDALFGTDVGNNSHYFKNTVRDANGQVSISYVDMHGRTIATALADSPAVSVDPLESNISNQILKKLLDSNSNVIKGTTIESSKGLQVTKEGPHKFVYSLMPDSISITACDATKICYDCIYDLKITITEDCSDNSKPGREPIVINRSNYKLDVNCDPISNFPMVDTTIDLYQGSYMVTKTLTVNKKAMDHYLNNVFLVRNTCRTLEQTILEQQTVMASRLSCDSVEEMSAEETIKEQMLADVTPPYGQYANPDNIDNSSVFWPFPIPHLNWRFVTGNYKDENGVAENPDPKLLSPANFSAAFKASWAETLLQLHPEYKKLVKYTDLAASNAWDKRFGSTETFQEAVNKGYLNPGNFSIHPTGTIFNHNATYADPLFTSLIAGGKVDEGYKNMMQDSLLHRVRDDGGNDDISMWSLATILTRCTSADASCALQYIPRDNAFTIDAACSGDLDMAWKYFREMYLQKKRDIMAAILRNAVGSSYNLGIVAQNHRLNFYDPFLIPVNDGMANNEPAGRDSLQAYINRNCEAYALQWMSDLGGCYDSTDLADIIPKLVQVCKEGGDIDHPMGASTVKPGSTNTYKSFEEVLKAHDASRYNSKCNVYLISGPAPYDQQPVYTSKPVFQKPDSCECATIGALYQKYVDAAKDSTFADYVYRTTGTQMQQGTLDTLRMACDGQINCSYLSAPVYLPPALQCGVKDVCVGCGRVDSLYKKYIAQFPDATPVAESENPEQINKNQLFERYMNTSLGFVKTTSEYLAFKKKCEIPEPTCASGTLTQWLDDYYKYGGIPHLDASGSDTTHWKANFGGTYYTLPVPLNQVIRNGVMSFPGNYPWAGFDYMGDSLCLDSAGFTWETRIKLPDSLVARTNLGAISWFWLYTDSAIGSGDLLMGISRLDGRGVAVCTHNNDKLASCADVNVPGQHFNDWRTIKFQVRGKSFKYLINDTLLAERTLDNYFTKLKRWNIEPFGNRIEIDYVRIYDTAGNMYYNENFDDAHNLATYSKEGRCEPCGERFANYFNQRNNSNYSVAQIDSIYFKSCGYHLTVCEESPLTLCGKTEPVYTPDTWEQRAPCADSTLFGVSTGVLIHEAYRDSLLNSFTDRYLAKCLSARYRENFTVCQPISEFHYTLYYYDQAGNLVTTIPPAGVDVSKFTYARAWSDSVTTARRNKQSLTPRHKLPTRYQYNTLNQVMAQRSPDGGKSQFWYDRLGRLAISQNARQKPANLYSYTRYDSLGRITEVGQVNNSGQSVMTDAISRNQSNLEGWLMTLYNKRGQITNTVYDLPYPGFVGLSNPREVIAQRNLRNRVSYTTITDTSITNAYNQGTFYTYDILGNVDHLLQDYGFTTDANTANLMNQNGNRWKKISYQYDLISGKVNMVMYQPMTRDAFYHRYSYDAENRLTLVETSRDSLVWEKDARYEYYRHGPLARVTLGDQQVQGLDYAYTLQGWLKGINSTGGSETYDMGADGKAGSLNQFTARDAMGLTLNYFGNEYTAINGTPFPGYSGKLPENDGFRPLYNGNISSSSVYQRMFEIQTGGPLIFYNYKYDQLNRLTRQDAYTGFNNTANEWNSPMTAMGEPLKERIVYDGNGNIQKYLRNSIKSAQPAMDSLTYSYYANTNQLRRIRDSVQATTFTDTYNRIVDIDSQPEDNYVYDSIGNLIADKQENITSIKWNVYGKITEITRTATTQAPASNIKYTYDAMGNRISQVVTSNGTKNYTWYVRDAQGNILSTYTSEGNNTDLTALRLKQGDYFMYGSSRLGTINVNDDNVDGGAGNTEFYYEGRAFGYNRGNKNYELTNHLGNVLATVSDRKFGVSSGGSSLISYYNPHIVTAQDYYPFGMLSRADVAGSSKSYRFGFNGKMNDNEVKGGLGNQQDYGMRIYDPRIGKFLSVDPLTKDYPWYTPYQFAGNTPIQAIDLDGLEPAKVGTAGTVVQDKSGQSWKSDGKTWVDNSTLETVTVSAPKPLSRDFTEWYSHNSKKYDSYQAAYDAWQSYPLSHNGESKWDRIFRMMASGSKEARREYSFGGYDMYNGLGRVSKAATATERVPIMAATTQAVEQGGQNIALSVTESLDRFARQVKGATYETWGTVNFPKQFLEVIKNPANKIHFNLDGVGDVTKAIEEGSKGFGVSKYVTSWELYQVYTNKSVLERTTFYLNGNMVPNPFK
jgi:RHS repeat-associated protein